MLQSRRRGPVMLLLLLLVVLAGCQQEVEFIGAGTPNTLWQPVVAMFDGVPMVRVPDGCFVMGRSGGPDEEAPPRRVCLTAFWIGQTEVTNAQYFACVEAGICSPPQNAVFFEAPSYASHPVVNITWEQADEYARWRGGSLPTEAQWEYAARGTASWEYPWGEEPPSCALANVSTCINSTALTGPDIRAEGASWVGALDMAGNVWEWTSDWFETFLYAGFEDGMINPIGPAEGQMRTLRGGAWGEDMTRAMSTYRSRHRPVSWNDQRGLRIVLPGDAQPDS